MADYYSRKEAELQGIKNDENEKAQAKKTKITSYLHKRALKIHLLGERRIQDVHGTRIQHVAEFSNVVEFYNFPN